MKNSNLKKQNAGNGGDMAIIYCMENLRTYINESRIKYLLIQNKITFDQLMSCLDCIEDTEEAIISFEKRVDSKALDYLRLYGLLQVLFVQQDALSHLNLTLLKKSLKLEEEYPELHKIRKIRNLSTGHPTGERTFNQIVRSSMRNESYTLITRYRDRVTTSQNINLIHLIQIQRNCISNHLNIILNHMKAEYTEHKKKFKDVTLMDEILPATDYFITKLHGPDLTLAILHQETLLNVLDKIKSGMVERYESLDARISFKHLHQELHFALIKLGEIFRSSSSDEINIYATFVKLKFAELKEMVAEVDCEFRV